MYVNYEILCNAFATRLINLSKVEIYKLKNSEMSKLDLENFLMEQNNYSIHKFYERYEKLNKLQMLEMELQEKKKQIE